MPPWPYLPEVGTLYQPNGDAVLGNLPPNYTQPNGPNTPVVPAAFDSAPGEFEPPLTPTGMYVFTCGHVFNCPAIFRDYDIITQKQKALICCPVCTLIGQIVDWDDFENYIKTPIVVA